MEFWDGQCLNININPVSYFFAPFFSTLIILFFHYLCVISSLYLSFSICYFFLIAVQGDNIQDWANALLYFHSLNNANLPNELDVYRFGGRKIDCNGSQWWSFYGTLWCFPDVATIVQNLLSHIGCSSTDVTESATCSKTFFFILLVVATDVP